MGGGSIGGGTLTTAGNLVFQSLGNGRIRALTADKGDILWEEGIGRLAAVYVICLFGFIIWVGLLISWIFFHGVKPPLAG